MPDPGNASQARLLQNSAMGWFSLARQGRMPAGGPTGGSAKGSTTGVCELELGVARGARLLAPRAGLAHRVAA